VRSGAAVTFPSSSALDACPHLRIRGGSPCSAVCVPVSFMGRAMGVIHTVAEEGHIAEPAEVDALSNLSTQAGARIGMLRTMVRTSLQASTDGLTGLMNRRTFQSRMRSMRRSGVSFTMVMADIDHFKRLNDTHGHETGDRALKTFCEVAAGTLRSTDLFARWGGEEFAFALVGLTAEDATEVLDRVRLELAAKLSTSDLPGFTVSYGVVDADHCATLDDAVRRADDALYEAKGAGRDRCVIAHTDGPATMTDVGDSPKRVKEPAFAVPSGVLARLAHDDDPMEM
jgi:diguanylate cyclase (GGDEF)-like protein